MSRLEEIYKEYRPLFDNDHISAPLMCSFVKKFIFPMYFCFNERIRKCEAQYEIYKNKPQTEKKNRRVVHVIPNGYVIVYDFCKKYYGSVGFMTNTSKADADLRPLRKKIGRAIYVDSEAFHNFFDSTIGRERYPNMAPKVDLYKEKLNERQRQRKTDSKSTALL